MLSTWCWKWELERESSHSLKNSEGKKKKFPRLRFNFQSSNNRGKMSGEILLNVQQKYISN